MSDNIDLTNSRVMIIDDVSEDIERLIEYLEPEGFFLSFANSGPQALKILPKILPNIILLDMRMPEMDGPQVLAKIRQIPGFENTPIIFVTGSSDANSLLEGLKIGAVDYLCKPIKKVEIIARIKTHLKNQRLTTEKIALTKLLKEQHDRITAIVENISDVICTTDARGKIESINHAGLKLFGYKQQELIGKNISKLFHPNCKKTFLSNMTKRQAHELVGIKKNKMTVPLDLTVKRMKHGPQDNLYVIVMHDMTLHKKIENELRRISGLDPLTNIPNRRNFDEAFKIEWNDSVREANSLAVIMIDIDYFKLYNDHYGHHAGDKCLTTVAKTIAKVPQRPKDLTARFGGEEFIVMLPHTDETGASQMAEHMRATIEKLKIPHQYSNAKPVVTISVGVVVGVPRRENNTEKFLTLADSALYQSKKKGRNQVTVRHWKP